MTPTDSNLRAALIGAANDFLTANSSIDTETGTVSGMPTMAAGDIAWENMHFKAGNKDTWARVSLLPAASAGGTIGHGGFDQESGILQIDINIPQGKGDSELILWDTKRRVFFHGGRTFSVGGHSVLVKTSEISQGRIIEGFYRKSISVNYISYLKRHTTI